MLILLEIIRYVCVVGGGGGVHGSTCIMCVGGGGVHGSTCIGLESDDVKTARE